MKKRYHGGFPAAKPGGIAVVVRRVPRLEPGHLISQRDEIRFLDSADDADSDGLRHVTIDDLVHPRSSPHPEAG